jgi:hypothetical protein
MRPWPGKSTGAITMKKTKADCGCEHRDGRWIKLCDKDARAWDELHAQAMKDHREREQERRAANG